MTAFIMVLFPSVDFAYSCLPCAFPEVGAQSMAKQKLSKTMVEGLACGSEEYVIWDSALPGAERGGEWVDGRE
jgi:hypothetical protein